MTRHDDDFDALGVAAIVGLLVVGLVAVTDLVTDGKLEAATLGLLAAAVSPLIPALIIRYGRRDDDDRK